KLEFCADTKLLDVGCGTGRHILELSRYPGTFVGLDMAREDLFWFRSWLGIHALKGPLTASVHMVEGDGERVPFADGLFDIVLCTETLEHVPNDRAILLELLRVLKPGGTLVISVPDEYSERILWRMSYRYRNTPGGHVRIYRRNDIKRLMRESGARPYAVEYRHSLESLRWIVHSTIDKEWGKPGRISRFLRWLLDTPSHRNWRILAWCDLLGSRVLPKSIVLYGRKAQVAS
ncbi:MAG TPA: class I SAM-dependent methyltransferase, partial [Candidatus Krumholzibacteria bacterium]